MHYHHHSGDCTGGGTGAGHNLLKKVIAPPLLAITITGFDDYWELHRVVRHLAGRGLRQADAVQASNSQSKPTQGHC